MNDFLWASGHLGWGVFSLAVFTCLWILLSDLIWRLRNVGINRLALALLAGWVAGAGIILLVSYWLGR